ncbi:MAG TPA: hypothetical protein VH877_16705 [Polyangia bacterium]|nr:hypothetical protein [Polyangia bacterium]
MMFACGGGGGGGSGETTQAEGSNYQFVANRILLPTGSGTATYSFDLNGDGNPENKLGSIIGALAAGLSLDVQGPVDAAVNAGQAVLLFNVQSTDASLASANNVGTTVYLGNQAANPPRFDGTDTFTVDPAVSGGVFLGKIAGSRFTSNNPATTKLAPVTVDLNLPIASAGTTLQVRLNGAHVQWRSNGATGLVEGQVNGSLKVSDLQTTVLPGVAALLNSLVQPAGCPPPSGSTAKSILDVLDKGGCTGAAANDCRIDVCELATNPLLQTVLTPDIQVYASNGTTYQPCKTGCTNDSISVGVGFTAVKATFTRP